MGAQSFEAPRHAFAHLFFALLAFVVLAPLTTGGLLQRLAYLAVTLAVLAAGVRLSWSQPRHRLVSLALAVPATVAAFIFACACKHPAGSLLLVFTAAFFVVATIRLLQKIVRDRVVTGNTLYGAASIYLFIGITWALFYFLLSLLQPDTLLYTDASRQADVAGSWASYIYFSFTTLATVGYGDITPATQIARSAVIAEVISGVFYVAVLVGRLVDLYRSKP